MLDIYFTLGYIFESLKRIRYSKYQLYICEFQTGLRYDREWLLKSLTGEILTQKKVNIFF
jgi:hypothetical protein